MFNDDGIKIKFIKEGQFIEKDGAPALTLAGEITGIFENGAILPTDVSHPFLSSHIQDAYGLTQYQVTCLMRKLNIHGNPKYHDPIKSGKKSFINKYSEALMEKISKVLERYPQYVAEACKDYQANMKAEREKKKNIQKKSS